MNEQTINNKEKWKPEPAETFEIEFLNTEMERVRKDMADLGFSFIRSGQEENGKVYFKGEREDGTTIRIIIEKGESYKSPAELDKEQAE